ncbi:isochorismatase family protein [Actinacidiphila sp. bgisy160]|uniref:isochorismatase family protein n=1 Tax=Actinacidiphila sp. bgisy160 TaxID=3413796 RepID=UPI003D75FE87
MEAHLRCPPRDVFPPRAVASTRRNLITPHKNIDVLANTDLEVQLRQHNTEYIAIAGMVGTTCVESTARSCMEHSFHMTTFTDATVAVGGPGRLRRDDSSVSVHLTCDAHGRRTPHRHARTGGLRALTGSTR